MKLLDRIERHLKETHMSATRFGRRAVGDPRFVLDLRMGRRPRRRTLERVEAYLASISPGQQSQPQFTESSRP
nr:hypothetical protein [Sphingobium indicum]